jgi:hypothetical protein
MVIAAANWPIFRANEPALNHFWSEVIIAKEYLVSTTGKPRWLDHVREVRGLHHDSIPTARAYGAWIWRDVQYHNMTRWQDLRDGARPIEAFLSHLAVEGNVSPSIQNQAMKALVFLDKQVLNMPVDQEIHALRSCRRPKARPSLHLISDLFSHVVRV